MGPTQMHLREWGWKAHWSESTLLLKENVGDLWKPNPAYGMGFSRQMLEEARIQILWTQAAMHRHGAGMEQGLFLTIATEHYNWYIKQGRMSQAGALMAVLTGALWP
eukprot:12357934-Karenia_brevis.AAC.1